MCGDLIIWDEFGGQQREGFGMEIVGSMTIVDFIYIWYEDRG
jgi:hypothetical protein